MKRHFLICALVLALLFSLLTGCKKPEPTTPDSTPGTSHPGTTVSTAPTESYDPDALVTIDLITGILYKTEAAGSAQSYRIQYDAAGKLLYVAQNGETPDILVQLDYDAAGNRIAYTNTILGIQQTYDPQGNILTDRKSNYSLTYTYDGADRCIVEERHSADGALLSRSSYTYDAQGNLISEVLERNGSIHAEIRHTYDAQNRHLTETFYRDGVVSPEGVSYVWQYDDRGNLLQEQLYYGALLGRRMEYTYDAAGNKLSACQYNSDGSAFLQNYLYDAAGNLLRWERITVDAKGTEYTQTSYYEYDDQGRMTLQRDVNQVGKERVFRWSYDENGNLAAHSFTSTDQSYQYRWTYDDRGNPLTETKTGDVPHEIRWRYDAQGRLLQAQQTGSESWTEQYTYDSRGNLTHYQQTILSAVHDTTYAYTSLTVTAREAALLLAQQAELLGYLEGGRFQIDIPDSPLGEG